MFGVDVITPSDFGVPPLSCGAERNGGFSLDAMPSPSAMFKHIIATTRAPA
jgi:hypothetical protein